MRKLFLMLILVLVSLPVVPVMSFAVDVEGLEQLLFMEIPPVFTVSKKAEKIQEAPAVVTVITAQEIKDFGASTLYDVIQRMPSVQLIGSHLYPRNAAVIRGDLISHYDNHVLILINGRPFRDDVAGGLNASFYNMFPVEVIDRIEYVHGPGSVLYGTNAYEGVINVITKKSEKDMETEISVGAGSFGANIGKGTVNLKKNDLSLLANINYLKDDGWDYNAVTADSTGVEVSGKTKFGNSNTSGSLFLTYKDFTFECYIANLKQGNLGIIPFWPATGQNGAAWLTTSRRFADIGYSKQLGDYNMQANVTYNYYVFECYCNNSLLSSEGAHDILGEVSIGGSVVENVNFIAGAVLTNQKNDNPTGAKIVDFDRNYYAGYLQFDYKPVDKLKLVGGAQYNKPEDIDAVTVPRIGGVYQFSDKLTAKASYSGAFRSPWPIESLTYFPGTLVGDPLLKPEKVKTVDCQVLYNTDKHHTGLTFFRSNYEDVITRITHPTIITTPKPTSSYDNSGEMEIQGFEIESKVSIKSGLYVEGSGTYQTEKNGKVLTPYFMAKAGVSYHAGFGLIASIFDNYFGEPRKNAGKVVNPEAKEVHLVSVNLDYTVPTMKSLSFNVFVQNALDQDYYYPEFSKSWVNTLPLEPGRAVYGTASYKF